MSTTTDSEYVARLRRMSRWPTACIMLLTGAFLLVFGFWGCFFFGDRFDGLKEPATGLVRLSEANVLDYTFILGVTAGMFINGKLILGTWMVLHGIRWIGGWPRTTRLLVDYADRLEAAGLLPAESSDGPGL